MKKGFLAIGIYFAVILILLVYLENFIGGLGEHGDASSGSIAESKDRGVFLQEYYFDSKGMSELETIVNSNNTYRLASLSFWVEHVYRRESFLL